MKTIEIYLREVDTGKKIRAYITGAWRYMAYGEDGTTPRTLLNIRREEGIPYIVSIRDTSDVVGVGSDRTIQGICHMWFMLGRGQYAEVMEQAYANTGIHQQYKLDEYYMKTTMAVDGWLTKISTRQLNRLMDATFELQ